MILIDKLELFILLVFGAIASPLMLGVLIVTIVSLYHGE